MLTFASTTVSLNVSYDDDDDDSSSDFALAKWLSFDFRLFRESAECFAGEATLD